MDTLPPGVDPSEIPAGTPPAGVVPNFVNPPSLSWAGRLAVYTTMPTMLLILSMRFYTRLRIMRQLGADDYLGLVSAVTVMAFQSTALILFLDDTYGRHLWDIPLSQLTPRYLQTLLVNGIIYDLGAMFCKVTLLTFYLRIFRPSNRARVLIWTGIGFVIVFYLTCGAINLVYCLPRASDRGGYTSTTSLARCNDHQQQLNFGQGVVSTVTDVYVLVVPSTMVISLHLSTTRKLSLLGLFMTGLITCAFSLAGTIYRSKANWAVPTDPTWYGLSTQALGVAELNLGVICACLPVIVPLFKKIADSSESAWKSFSGLFTSASKQSSKPQTEMAGFTPNVLTTVPRGTLKGLSSFIHNFRGTRSQQPTERHRENEETTTQGTYFELRSVDCDYHAHIESNPFHTAGSKH